MKRALLLLVLALAGCTVDDVVARERCDAACDAGTAAPDGG